MSLHCWGLTRNIWVLIKTTNIMEYINCIMYLISYWKIKMYAHIAIIPLFPNPPVILFLFFHFFLEVINGKNEKYRRVRVHHIHIHARAFWYNITDSRLVKLRKPIPRLDVKGWMVEWVAVLVNTEVVEVVKQTTYNINIFF